MQSNRAPAATVPDPSLASALATKLLGGWLTNRGQTLMPHTLSFRTLTPHRVELVLAAMAAAVQATGAADATGRNRADLALGLVEASASERDRYQALLSVDQPIAALLAAAGAAGIGVHAYAGALLVVDRASPVVQAFLAYMAARLALPGDLTRALESRYRT